MAQVALTTVFQPPESCFNNVYTSLGGNVYEKDVSILSSECYPASFHSIFSEGIPYSPGVCPSGYGYDSTTAYGDDATAALCCPLGMTAYADGSMGCSSVIDGPVALSVDGSTITLDEGMLAVHGIKIAWSSDDIPVSEAGVTTSSSIPPTAPSAYPSVPLAYPAPSTSSSAAERSSEVVDSSTGSSPTASSTSVSSTDPIGSPSTKIPKPDSPTALTLTKSANTRQAPPRSTNAASDSAPHPAPQSNTFSTEAKAGIGAGVGVAGAAVLALAVWFVFRKKRSPKYDARPYSSQPEYTGDVGPAAMGRAQHMSELSTEGGRSELSAGLQGWDVQKGVGRPELYG